MRKVVILFCLLVHFLSAGIATAGTSVLQANKDTFIDSINKDYNFGQDWKMLINGSSPPSHGLLHFDFSSLPEMAQIDDATLTFLVHSNWRTTFYIIHPLAKPWEEDTTTWIQATESDDWNSPGGDYQSLPVIESPLPASLPDWMVTDIAYLLKDDQGRLNTNIAENGLLIRADTQFSKIVSNEFKSFERSETCHSCHGGYSSELDEGKSTECENCHIAGNIPLAGEPTLIVNYTLPSMLFQFVQLSDTHIGRTSQQSDNLNDAVGLINDINPAFVLFTGDLTERGETEEYESFKEIISNLTMPFYCVPGDNDIVDAAPIGGTLERYRQQLGDDYYSFNYQGLKFIGVNNNVDRSLDEVQKLWLKEELNEAKPKILFAHKALLNLQDGEPLPDGEDLLAMFDWYHVLMYVNGDNHESNEISKYDMHFIWCDNLSFAHLGDTFNLYQIYPECILLYHMDIRDGSKVFAGQFPLAYHPDLIIGELSLESEDSFDEHCTLNYTVENQGSVSASESTTCLRKNGVPLEIQQCPELASGEFYEGYFEVSLNNVPVEICTDWLDDEENFGVVDEENEANNCSEYNADTSTTTAISMTTTSSLPDPIPTSTSTSLPVVTSTTSTTQQNTTSLPTPLPTTTTSVKKICLFDMLYGEDSFEVRLLHSIRDNLLSLTPEGRALTEFYYQWNHLLLPTIKNDESFAVELKAMINETLHMLIETVE